VRRSARHQAVWLGYYRPRGFVTPRFSSPLARKPRLCRVPQSLCDLRRPARPSATTDRAARVCRRDARHRCRRSRALDGPVTDVAIGATKRGCPTLARVVMLRATPADRRARVLGPNFFKGSPPLINTETAPADLQAASSNSMPAATAAATSGLVAALDQRRADRRQPSDLMAVETANRPKLLLGELAPARMAQLRVAIDDLLDLVLGGELATSA
jgi:hypothetical protein